MNRVVLQRKLITQANVLRKLSGGSLAESRVNERVKVVTEISTLLARLTAFDVFTVGMDKGRDCNASLCHDNSYSP
jgi:uncharacterized protein YfaQ (DUF2300 family)